MTATTAPRFAIGNPVECRDGRIRPVIGMRYIPAGMVYCDRPGFDVAPDEWQYLIGSSRPDGECWGWEPENSLNHAREA
jgi:hypothetical protein